jgi:hypothetical protein
MQRPPSSYAEAAEDVPRLRGAVIVGGQELAGGGFIGGSYQHANTLKLQLWLLPSGIVCGQDRCHAVTAQHADDQFRLDAATGECYGHTRDLAGSLRRSPCHRDHLRLSGRNILTSSTYDTIPYALAQDAPVQGLSASLCSDECGRGVTSPPTVLPAQRRSGPWRDRALQPLTVDGQIDPLVAEADQSCDARVLRDR